MKNSYSVGVMFEVKNLIFYCLREKLTKHVKKSKIIIPFDAIRFIVFAFSIILYGSYLILFILIIFHQLEN